MNVLPDSMTLGEAKQFGRLGDTELVHLNKAEVAALSSMSPTGGLTLNPTTGQPEAFLPFLAPLISALLPSGLSIGGLTLGPMALSSIASGLGTWASTGDLKKGLLSGLGGFALGSALGGAGELFKGVGDAASNTASTVASQAGSAASQAGQGIAGLTNQAGQAAAQIAPGISPAEMINLTKDAPMAMANAAPTGMSLAPDVMTKAQQMAVGLPGMVMSAGGPTIEYEQDPEKKRRAERAAVESKPMSRTISATPDGYRPGIDGEHMYFDPASTVTQVDPSQSVLGKSETPSFLDLLHGDVGLSSYIDAMKKKRKEENFAEGGMVSAPFDASTFSFARPTFSAPAPRSAPLVPRHTPTTPAVTQQPIREGRQSVGGTGSGGIAEVMGRALRGGDWKSTLDPQLEMMMQRAQYMPMYANGGLISGQGDGTSDGIAAMINGRHPARISDGEYIVPADVVAHLGNGSSKAGAKRMDTMVRDVRKAKTGKPGLPKRI